MDPRKYWTMCRTHDWFYPYSDDPGVNRDGKEARAALLTLADLKPELMDVFKAWEDHMFASGPRPPEPKMED